jgi:hypothetical protein
MVCDQITDYMTKKLSITKKSTRMIQQEWVENSAKKLITGVLLWDLSAASDTLDPILLGKKLKIYGFS